MRIDRDCVSQGIAQTVASGELARSRSRRGPIELLDGFRDLAALALMLRSPSPVADCALALGRCNLSARRGQQMTDSQLQPTDRWKTRHARALRMLREEGIAGIRRGLGERGVRGSWEFV